MGGSREMSRPAWTMEPALWTSSPATMRSSVVLPQPDGPRKQTSSPCRTPSETPFSATNFPNSLRIPESSRKSPLMTVERRYASVPTGAPLFFRLCRVPLLPFGEDAVAVLRGEREIVLDEALVEVGRQVREHGLHVGMRHQREVLREMLVGLLGRDPVHELLRRIHLLRVLHDARGLDIPAQALLREHELDRRALLLHVVATKVERDADHELARARLAAGLRAGGRVLPDVLVQAIHVLPAALLAVHLQPGAHIEVPRAA